MPVEKIISHWPHALTSEDAASEARATSETAATLYGRNRWLAEFIKGGPADDVGSVQIFANPQGTRGQDHSGPPFGPAFRRTLASWSGSASSTATNTWTPHINGVDSSSSAARVEFRFRWQSRAFDEHEGAPYSTANVAYLVNCHAGTATVVVRIAVRPVGGEWVNLPNSTHSITTTLTQFAFADPLTGIRSGKRHEARIQFVCTARTSSARVYPRSVVIYNNNKL